MQKFFFMMLVVLMGGMVTSCGSDDGDDAIDNYKLVFSIADRGTMTDEEYQINLMAIEMANTQYPKTTLALAKSATDAAIQQSLSTFAKADSNYTIEVALYDSNNKKVYSRYIIVKDHVATIQ